MENKHKLKLVKSKRETIYARVTELHDMAKKLPASLDTRSVDEFINMSANLNKLYDSFSQVCDEYNEVSMILDEKYAVSYGTWMSFEALFSYVQQARENILESRKSRSAFSVTEKNKVVEPHNIKIKLPALDIKSFDGSPDNWPLFMECFKINIHLNQSLDNAQKVQYLVSKLKGRALSVVSGIVPNGENYQTIWESLVNKYQDARSLGNVYLKNILSREYIPNNSESFSEFVDSISSSVAALKNLNIEDLSGFILTHIILKKLDWNLANTFEQSVRDKETITYDDLLKYLKYQVKVHDRMSETSCSSSLMPPSVSNKQKNKFEHKAMKQKPFKNFSNYKEEGSVSSTHAFAVSGVGSAPKCACCNNGEHDLLQCKKFKDMSVKSRFHFIKKNRGCINCLGLSHTVSKCNADAKCTSCEQKHNLYLHFKKGEIPPSAVASNTLVVVGESAGPLHKNASESNICTSVTMHTRDLDLVKNKTVVLSTAQVFASLGDGKQTMIRCLIDSASQNNLICYDLCKKLGLLIKPVGISLLKTLGSVQTKILGTVSLKMKSRVSCASYDIDLLVVNKIIDRLPIEKVDVSKLFNLSNLTLADESWSTPSEVEVILGAQLFSRIILGGKVSLAGGNSECAPSALETTLGYIIMGDCPVFNNGCEAWSFGPLVNEDIDDSLTRFWKLEEIPTQICSSKDDLECETVFSSQFSRRESDGRYVVPLIFRENPSVLGDSHSAALRRFLSLERKFQLQSSLRTAYNDVITDYLGKGYLSEIEYNDKCRNSGYFVPHHPIVKMERSSTKTRLVLDASCKTGSGHSLNDILHVGPNLQADLFKLLLNFRLLPVSLSADIQQMYLRILVREGDKQFQKILFRFSESEPIRAFQFNSVAFGLRCSPFLALRTIKQLALDEINNFPRAAQVAASELYMDDLTTSVMSVEDGINLAKDLRSLFKSGGFNLVKWTSNSGKLMTSLPDSSRAQIEFTDSSTLKILGMKYIPISDHFIFVTSEIPQGCTKRLILSTIARLFDVLGLVAPVLLYAKLLIQELWLAKIGWDDDPHPVIKAKFEKLKCELPLLAQLRIPRHIGVHSGCSVSLLGFGDACTKSYGCVVYLRVKDTDGYVTMNLVCAKSRVAPLKTVTVARLELSAALLLAQVIDLVYTSFKDRYPIDEIYAFTDSSIVMSWVHSSPHRFKTFVANRISRIQEILPAKCFYHVYGDQNPSDCLSRGLLPSQLLDNELWWRGPQWAIESFEEWPVRSGDFFRAGEPLELKSSETITAVVGTASDDSMLLSLAERLSSWSKLLRCVVYVYRFLKILPLKSFVTASDLEFAESKIIQALQAKHFEEDIKNLASGKLCCRRLQRLKPYIRDGIVRVGGRIEHSNLSYERRHPIVLPRKDHVVDLIIEYYHKVHCHAGPDLLLSILRQKFWIFSARSVIRGRIYRCIPCFKVKPKQTFPEMADLKACRVLENVKPFIHVATDFAGPFKVSAFRARGQRSRKAWACFFVCLTTRALHIELASELSTASFLAALNRFLARRGAVSHLYSDCGTNYVGSRNYLNELYNFVSTEDYKKQFSHVMSENRITWHLNPPAAPHFNGMAESAVKCVKTHIYRVIGEQILTFEEMNTLLTQIESLLNSRPLCRITSADPSEPEALTPAHFLTLTPVRAFPTEEISEDRLGILPRYAMIDKLVQSFWKRWKNEYLHSLQLREKWCSPSNPLTVGTIVIVNSDNVAPLHWPLGVIEAVHLGADNVARVARVKTCSGSYLRPVTRLCPLPNQ